MATTAMMEQYQRIKRQHNQAILFFRMGDFYEMFHDDAKVAAKVLGLALTSRAKGENAVPMAGVPYHAVSQYLKRLVEAGYDVAICEQVEDPAKAKGLVKREVIRVVTAGTITDDILLDDRQSNYLVAVLPQGKTAGLACAELSTGAFFTEEVPLDEVEDELFRLQPAECLIPEGAAKRDEAFARRVSESFSGKVTQRSDWAFNPKEAARLLENHFQVKSLDGFGLAGMTVGVGAAGAVFEYLRETQKSSLSHLLKIEKIAPGDRLILDRSAQRSLELVRTEREGRVEGSLLWVLDKTVTAMGARLMREWLTSPLVDVARINERLDAVGDLLAKGEIRARVRQRLAEISDLERIATRLATETAKPADLVALAMTAEALPAIKQAIGQLRESILGVVANEIDTLDNMRELIRIAVVDNPSANPREGGVIRQGYDEELDKLRSISRDGKSWLAEYQRREIERTGIDSLRVAYNRVFGYYIHITNSYADRVPPNYIRKQTLKNAERYVTPELREYESQVLSAQERSSELEFQIFSELVRTLAAQVSRLQTTAAALAEVDVFAALAQAAEEGRYSRPEVDDSRELHIDAGRHPVLDLALEEEFVPNDLNLGTADCDLAIITGPNMAGKSTYIRQAALIVIMAQMGSFVPAKKARIGVADRIFARVGAADELARGQSTFMVEMTETANILNNATDRSLVVLDEVGRGTSTFDGLSLAWAVSEELASKVKARTLFATHYHELTELALLFDNVKNYNVRVSEWQGHVTFHHEIVPGGTDKSYGIYVAKLAGVPDSVVERAKAILSSLEAHSVNSEEKPAFVPRENSREEAQLGLFAPRYEKIIDELRATDVDGMTPIQALLKLKELKEKSAGGRG
jgi:DNA mismatch repair protein MutS